MHVVFYQVKRANLLWKTETIHEQINKNSQGCWQEITNSIQIDFVLAVQKAQLT
jgi:hypothetical protein